MMSEIMVNVKGLRKQFTDDAGVFDVLKDVNFTVTKGEMVALVGNSGAGKTTLLQILGGLDRFDNGTLEVGGQHIGNLSNVELAAFRNNRIGFVFQFHHLLPDFTAIENVILPGLIRGKKPRECMGKAREMLDVFGLSNRTTHFPTELSGGERQRVALARALFNDPDLILADEPTGNLDKANGEILLQYFIKANRELNQTFIIATHNSQLNEGMRRTLYLDDGKIRSQEGAPV